MTTIDIHLNNTVHVISYSMPLILGISGFYKMTNWALWLIYLGILILSCGLSVILDKLKWYKLTCNIEEKGYSENGIYKLSIEDNDWYSYSKNTLSIFGISGFLIGNDVANINKNDDNIRIKDIVIVLLGLIAYVVFVFKYKCVSNKYILAGIASLMFGVSFIVGFVSYEI